MTKNDQKWPKMAKNGQKWPKMAKKWPNMAKHGQKCVVMAFHSFPFVLRVGSQSAFTSTDQSRTNQTRKQTFKVMGWYLI
jgi:hypothetical protein